MTRISTIAGVALSALALAACGSSNKSSSTHSTPTSAAVASTPTSAATTPTTSSIATGTGTGTSTTPTGGTSVAAFRAAIVAERDAGKSLGPALVKALQNAGSMSNATFASTFSTLGAQFAQYAAGIGRIQAPPQYRAKLAAVHGGFAKLATDLTSLSQSTTAAQSRARSQQLVKDIHALQASENRLDKAAGIPRG